jgi:16S rRNA (guanine966-N2)-methyltransferase
MALRVIGGEAGGRRLVAPKGGARPTADRVKESLFASLGAERLGDAAVLDLYAGSGALGIEALSRGAARAVFVDNDRRAREALVTNLDTTGFTDRAQVRTTSAAVFAAHAADDGPFDLVFVDPPYDLDGNDLTHVLVGLTQSGCLGPGATVVVETGRRRAPVLPEGWTVGWARAYGDTLLTVATV